MRQTILFRQWVVLGLVVWLTGLTGQAMAQQPDSHPTEIGTSFTYEGYLTDENGNPLEGVYDLEFKLYDAPSDGNQLGTAVVSDNITVLEGRFSVPLDFGRRIFTGDTRYLEMGLRPGKRLDAFTPLPGRQQLPVAAYALALPNLWTEPNPTSPNLIGGHRDNSVTRGVIGATIAGGGAPGQTNRITDDYGVIGGGHNNQAGDNTGLTSDTSFATVGGGLANNALSSYATVDGGWLNRADGPFSTIGGGSQNSTGDIYATVGGGLDNTAGAPGAASAGAGSTTPPTSTPPLAAVTVTRHMKFIRRWGAAATTRPPAHGRRLAEGITTMPAEDTVSFPAGRIIERRVISALPPDNRPRPTVLAALFGPMPARPTCPATPPTALWFGLPAESIFSPALIRTPAQPCRPAAAPGLPGATARPKLILRRWMVRLF
ncbi:MAG: hypothetical protein HC875_01890 [Anaerolineales bacterium]|nr:hypothetical protein [Anaerolineales bacterium]